MSIKKISKLQPETFAFSKDNFQNAEKEIGSVTTSFASQRNDEIYESFFFFLLLLGY